MGFKMLYLLSLLGRIIWILKWNNGGHCLIVNHWVVLKWNDGWWKGPLPNTKLPANIYKILYI